MHASRLIADIVPIHPNPSVAARSKDMESLLRDAVLVGFDGDIVGPTVVAAAGHRSPFRCAVSALGEDPVMCLSITPVRA